MRKRKFAALCLLLFALCLLPVSAQAASQKTKALKAYRKYLSQEKISYLDVGGMAIKFSMQKCKFATAYIDNDSVPELIVYSPEVMKDDLSSGLTYGGDFYGATIVYTYKNGKVKRTAVTQLIKCTGYYKKQGVFVERFEWREGRFKGQKKVEYHILKNGRMRDLDYSEEKALKKRMSGKKMSKFVFRKNNAANRKKYLN